jgi:hypothetical protein
MDRAGLQGNVTYTTNFVPGEICIVVCAEAIPDGAGLYSEVRDWLESRITAMLQAGEPPSPDPVEVELGLGTLRQPATDHWLLPFSPHGLDPWIVLDPVFGDGRWRALFFYQVTLTADEPDDPGAAVRRLVNVINLKFVTTDLGHAGPWTLCGATPNWYTVTASGQTCGGPGGKPEPAQDGHWGFVLNDPALSWQLAAAGAQPPVVLVLDTCPDQVTVDAAAARYPRNGLLQQAVGPGRRILLDDPAFLGIDQATPIDSLGQPVLPNWYGPERDPPLLAFPYAEFEVQDHGLFAAGIVSQVSPNAVVRVVRVLGKYGVGDLAGLATVIAKLPGVIMAGAPGPVIVNLSLTIEIPPSDRVVQRQFPRLDPKWIPGRRSEYQLSDQALVAIRHLDGSVRPLVEFLIGNGMLVVAAAGNDAVPVEGEPRPDSPPEPIRPEPRFPARCPDVLCVGALQKGTAASPQAPADYSNRATAPAASVFGPPSTSTGIAVMGGNADLDTWHGLPPVDAPLPPQSIPAAAPDAWYGPRQTDVRLAAVPGAADGVNGVVGLFTADPFPFALIQNPTGGPPPLVNQSGWAHWVGTSFAAPIVSGIAANAWSTAAAGQPPAKVRAAVQSAASFNVPNLACDGIEVSQVQV